MERSTEVKLSAEKKSKKAIRIVILLSLIIIAAAAFMIFVTVTNNQKSEKITTCRIEKRDLQVLISSTGTLNAKGAVEIGTQVSGTISKVFFNYNDTVKKGDLLALLDTKLLEIAVKQAEADLLKVKAQYDLNKLDHQNKSNLAKNNLISNYEFEQSKVTVASTYAQLLSAEANLDKAKTNLGYAYIRSPIDGTILDIAVEEGQTVSASTSAPTLFLLAESLDKMEIHASVDESDIGQIRKGQNVIFTIESDNTKKFNGVVREVRLKPTTTSNVVNYTVIIDADNRNDILLPGMTATIDFIVQEEKGVYAIANSALRVQPPVSVLKAMQKKGPPQPPQGDHPDRPHHGDATGDRQDSSHSAQNGDQVKQSDIPQQTFSQTGKSGKGKNKDRKKPSIIWKKVSETEYVPVPVKTGITDGVYTQLLRLHDEDIDAEYIANVVTSGGKTKSNAKSGQRQNMQFQSGGMGRPMMR